MFADLNHAMSMLAAPQADCALPNTNLVDSNMQGGYFCPATLNGASAYRYVQGENQAFKKSFGPDEKSKGPQFCSFIAGVGVVCSKYVPCGASLSAEDLTTMTGKSCGCVGYKYCVNGVGSDTA